ncbi:hypothetical protein IT575_02265 [bacterium]|nr:hypothetical protein [bacterium]
MLGALAAIVLLLGYAGLDYTVLSRPRPTGDALRDEFDREMWKSSRRIRLQGKSPGDARPDPAKVAQWEQRFGQDPRYWQLRYWIKRKGDLLNAWHELELGQQRGASDATSLVLLCSDFFATQQLSLKDREALAREALLLAPDCALPHYLLATLRFEQNQKDDAIALLRSGLACSQTNLPPAFPLGMLQESATAGQRPAAWFVLDTTMDVDPGSNLLVPLTVLERKVIHDPQQHYDPELYDLLLDIACSYAASLSQNSAGGMYLNSVAGSLVKTAYEAEGIGPKQQACLIGMDGLQRRMSKHGIELLQRKKATLIRSSKRGRLFTQYDPFGIGRASSEAVFLDAYLDDRHWYLQTYDPYIKALSDFSFREMRIPPSAQKILREVPDPWPGEGLGSEKQNTQPDPLKSETAPPGDMPLVPPDGSNSGWED